MNKTILKVVEQNHYDRYVFLTYHNEQIIGLNFHQGIGEIDYSFSAPCPKLTEIFDRYGSKYSHLDWDEKVNMAIDLYQEAFIFQRKAILLPKEQNDIIKNALEYYLDGLLKFTYEFDRDNKFDNGNQYKIHDLTTLIAFMGYDVKIDLTETDIKDFTSKNGIDLPIYTN